MESCSALSSILGQSIYGQQEVTMDQFFKIVSKKLSKQESLIFKLLKDKEFELGRNLENERKIKKLKKKNKELTRNNKSLIEALHNRPRRNEQSSETINMSKVEFSFDHEEEKKESSPDLRHLKMGHSDKHKMLTYASVDKVDLHLKQDIETPQIMAMSHDFTRRQKTSHS